MQKINPFIDKRPIPKVNINVKIKVKTNSAKENSDWNKRRVYIRRRGSFRRKPKLPADARIYPDNHAAREEYPQRAPYQNRPGSPALCRRAGQSQNSLPERLPQG